MKASHEHRGRRLLGRISTQTKGPPGLHLEMSGQWNGRGLTS
ncbi:MAG TPA: hypothetical protein VKC17_09380 [Sphingomicrobium sp.]|nr:hypothetical protein [Sphingomicrobium sp.]